jgi:hypothetical protein
LYSRPTTGILLLEVFGQKEIDEYAITEGEKLTVSYVPKVHEGRRQSLRQEQRHLRIEREESQPFAE